MTVEDTPTKWKRARWLLWIAAITLLAGMGAWKMIGPLMNSDVTCSVTLSDIVKPGAVSGYNVLLITLDTTRADHLGCYGYKYAKTPAIDSLLDHGVRFDDAIASVPVTLPSHASILTGLDPYHHGVRNNGTYRLAAERTTLAEMLADHGYDTAAFISCFVLDKRFGLDQGFEVYDFAISDAGWRNRASLANERGANHVTTAALKWLKARGKPDGDRPFFLWVHYYDPHAPYESPLWEPLRRSRGAPGPGPYDAEIEFVDLHLGRLLDKLDAQHLRERTLIVLVSDHGEALGEHGEQRHGLFLYEASMRAALIFSCPTIFDESYRVDDRVVGTVDIVPTVAGLLGVPLAGPVDGLDLLTSAADPERAIYIETLDPKERMRCAPLYGLRRHHDKFILAPRSEYYNLRLDPKEMDNLYATAPRAGVLEGRLSEIMSGWSDSTAAKRTMTFEEVRRLASLGYVFGGDTEPDNLLDPKDQLPILNELGAARWLVRQGRYAEAVVAAKEMGDQAEGIALTVYILADAYVGLGRQDEAARVLSEFAEKYPSVDVLILLANRLSALKRYDEMEEKLQAAELIKPLEGSIPMLRGDHFFEEGRYAEAVAQYEKALEMDPHRIGPDARDKLQQARQRLRETAP